MKTKAPPRSAATLSAALKEPDKTSTAQISAAWARTLLDYLRSVGVKPSRLYPAELLSQVESSDAHTQLSLARWLEMFDTAIQATGDRDLPLKVGESVKVQHFGLVGYVIMSSRDVEEAMAQHQRYLKLVWQAARAYLLPKGRKTELHWVWTQGATPPEMEQMNLASRMIMVRWLTSRPDLKWDAHFQHQRPRDISNYQRIFGGTIRFGQKRTLLVLPTEHLHLPVLTANPATQGLAEEHARQTLQSLDDPQDLIERLTVVLRNGLAAGHVTLKHAAQAMKTSTRTLRRRLEEQGRSFREVLDDLRLREARKALLDSQVPLATVAFILGYSEQSTFQQAFKRWTGMTPGDYRNQRTRLT